MPRITNDIINLTTREEDLFVDKINKIIPILNGYDPKNLKESDYGPPQLAKSKHYGPKVMSKKRDMVLLYIGNRISYFRLTVGKEIDGLVYFTAYSIEKIAQDHRFKPNRISYRTKHADERYQKYKDE